MSPFLPRSHPYRKHSENFRAVSAGLTQAERFHKEAIRRGDDPATEFAARVHHMMVGLMAEAALRKISTDPAGFNARERTLLGQERSQISRWKRAVEFAFRRHHAIPIHLEVDATTTNAAVAVQFATITSLLENDLAEVIEDRNKIAHAQWVWLLNNTETAFTGRAAPPLNYKAIDRRARMITNIAHVINDLVVSERTFQRDFQQHYNAILNLQQDLAGSDFPAFVAELRRSRRPIT